MRVLLVEDEQTIAVTLTDDLEAAGHDVEHVADGAAAIAGLKRKSYDVVITDVRLPGADGLEVLQAAKQARPDTEVLMMTAYATVEHAVEAMRLGADDYIQKPFLNEHVVDRLQRIGTFRALVDENQRLKERLQTADGGLPGVIGESRAMRAVVKTVRTVAATDASVLIEGESGTGKERIARAVHRLSARKDRAFVALSCGALPDTLLETELFGHEKGAFTGAVTARKGRFELAEGGTLFLDEIGDMPFDMQVKLLRVLQERTYERVGGGKPQKADVRIVAATHQNLEGKVESGDFRMDLYYRLNVFPIDVPPLRERPEDVPLLARRFIALQEAQTGETLELSREALEQLCQCEWPGNVRELGNLIERLMILYPGETVGVAELPDRYARAQGDWVQPQRHDPTAVARFIDDLFKGSEASTENVAPLPLAPEREDLSGLFAAADQLPPLTPHVVDFAIGDIDLKDHLARIEKDLIYAALEHSDWINAQAAKRLNLQRTTLVEKMRKYNIQRA